uniref:RNase H type-1 domain-containing protein n=1 Tax=Cannabis sativa TaxID=3483 RepID=A0A803RAK7_CANSA
MINTLDNSWAFNSQQTTTTFALEAESKAILFALSWAIQNDWREVHVLFDSQVVIQALERPRCIPN